MQLNSSQWLTYYYLLVESMIKLSRNMCHKFIILPISNKESCFGKQVVLLRVYKPNSIQFV